MIGRQQEKQELLERYESGRAELVVVHGRYRIGKTFLANATFENRITFRHAGISPVEENGNGLLRKQLDQFYFSLRSQGMSEAKKPKSWMEAFFYLEMFLQKTDSNERQLVFIDELPWMDTPRSGFLTAVEGFWNNWGCHRKNLMVIVCGSASAWILDNLINNHGGLYGRVTCEIRLHPFTLQECEMFLKERGIDFPRYDIVQSYMAVGGIPYYLDYMKRNLSLAQNLDEMFFSQGAKLTDEFSRLFTSIFDKPALMHRIVRILSLRNRGFTRSEILDKLEMKDGETFSSCIKALISSDFVLKYIPFGSKANEPHYKLIDPFCMFWLHFRDENMPFTENYWTENLDSPKIVSWRGFAFENVCWNHIPQIKRKLGISGVSADYSAWTRKADDEEGLQIDMLISRKDHVVNMCEMKYWGDDFTVNQDYYRILLRRKEILAETFSRKASIHCTLITTFGLRKNPYSDIFTDVMTLNDLFEPL